MIDQLELALNGHYTVINDLVRVLYNGSLCKQIVDAAIDRCKSGARSACLLFIFHT